MSVSPPRPKGPALNALRAFEAAARLESFALAAEELSVTPGAISQHIKSLEEWTGVPLFKRNAQGVQLTSKGKAIAPQFVQAFDMMGEAVRGLVDARPTREIQIATMPSLAQLWLPRKLRRIRAKHPDIRISVTALETPPNLRRELFDLSIFIRSPSGDGSQEVIEADELFPVCAPSLAEQIKTPADLDRFPYLIDRSWVGDWATWANAAEVTLHNIDQGARYSLYSLAQEEAKSGAGVLMAHSSLSAAALASGELVRLFETNCPTAKPLVLEMLPRDRTDTLLSEIVSLLRE